MIVAHAGHWLANLLYLLPVVVIGGMLGWQAVKDRRARRRGEVGEEAAEPEAPPEDPGP